MGAMTAHRMDQLLRPEVNRLVNILEDVMQVPNGHGGPTWVLQPSREVQRRFWESSDVDPHHRVSIAVGDVLLEQVRDVHERPIPGLHGLAGKGALFFIDREPNANWAHACEYVVVPDGGGPTRATHSWPPSASFTLEPLPRLALVP